MLPYIAFASPGLKSPGAILLQSEISLTSDAVHESHCGFLELPANVLTAELEVPCVTEHGNAS